MDCFWTDLVGVEQRCPEPVSVVALISAPAYWVADASLFLVHPENLPYRAYPPDPNDPDPPQPWYGELTPENFEVPQYATVLWVEHYGYTGDENARFCGLDVAARDVFDRIIPCNYTYPDPWTGIPGYGDVGNGPGLMPLYPVTTPVAGLELLGPGVYTPTLIPQPVSFWRDGYGEWFLNGVFTLLAQDMEALFNEREALYPDEGLPWNTAIKLRVDTNFGEFDWWITPHLCY